MEQQEKYDRFELELKSFKMRNAQRSLPDYTLSTKTTFTPRPRYRGNLDDDIMLRVREDDDLTPESKHTSSQEEIFASRNLYDTEIRVSKVAALTSLLSVILAVIVAVVTFVVTATARFDPATFISQTISLTALIVIAWLALRSSQRAKESARALLAAE